VNGQASPPLADVHFMLDQRKPLGFLTFVKDSAIKEAVGSGKKPVGGDCLVWLVERKIRNAGEVAKVKCQDGEVVVEGGCGNEHIKV
jgi:hypothetical protein